MKENIWRTSLKEYEPNFLGVRKVRKVLFEELGQHFFDLQSLDQLVFHGLRLIDETKLVRNTTRSLNQGMKVVRDYFDYPVPNHIEKKNDKDEIIKNFCHYLFGIKQLPYPYLKELKTGVETDLKEINELIEYYESLPQIKSLLEGDAKEAGKSHMVLHFYGRCVEERKRILNYYLEGMYSEAKFRSDSGIGWASHSIMLNRTFNPPYNFGSYFFRRNYDYRKIDQASHRLYSSNIYTDDIDEYLELYRTDKTSFYSKLFQSKKHSEIFNEIQYRISLLRLSEQRKEIFIQLERLFNAREWLAFYAIALPQVEGLFAEMLTLAKGEERKNALSAKVRAVRSISDSNERTFDYYEYILPEQRNQFAHGGLLGDYELRAYDLLTDLEVVLRIFTDLNNPFVQVSTLLTRKNIIDLPDLESIATYFYTLDKLKSAHRKQLIQEIEVFNNSFLINECQLESISKQGFIDYKLTLEKLSSNFSGQDGEYGLPSLKSKGIKKQITNLNKDYLQSTFIHRDHEIDEVLVFDQLMQGIKKWIAINERNDFLKDEFNELENDKMVFINLKELKNMVNEMNLN